MLTSVLLEPVDLEESLRKSSLCSGCDIKKEAERMKKLVERVKPMITMSKVILGDIVAMTFLAALLDSPQPPF